MSSLVLKKFVLSSARRFAVGVDATLQAWVGGFSDLMDEIRAFMATRKAPFRLESLRAIFVTPEDDVDDDEKVSLESRRESGISL